VLLQVLELSRDLLPAAERVARRFPLIAPRDFVSRMRKGDPKDPLLRQVLPLHAEELDSPGYVRDPVGDGPATVTSGLLRKYHGRALLVAAGVCAIHCRYCFRREYPYGDMPKGPAAMEPALDAVRSDESIEEVILSGGDPLMLTDDSLERLVRRIADVRHVRRVRIHTRLPIVIPERTTAELRAVLRGTRLTPIVVVHVNHPNELAGRCVEALKFLVDGGVPILNQTVLLRGVNDDIDTLARLSSALVDLRVIPYYLHQLDRVRGTAHFEVPESRGLELVRALRERLPGYAVPRYVREVPGERAKIDVGMDVQSVVPHAQGG